MQFPTGLQVFFYKEMGNFVKLPICFSLKNFNFIVNKIHFTQSMLVPNNLILMMNQIPKTIVTKKSPKKSCVI